MNITYFVTTILLGGVATTAATQLLKSNLIPVAFQAHKRLTAGVVAIVATYLAEITSGLNLSLVHDPAQWASLVLGTFFIAISTYNNLKGGNA